MTSSGKKFEEIVKDLIVWALIVMMEILQMEMAAKDDAAIVKTSISRLKFKDKVSQTLLL